MALTQLSTTGIKDNAVTSGKIPANAVGNSELANNCVGVAELSATGTPSSSTFLSGDNSWTTVSTDLVADTSPQLGGHLDSNNFDIKLKDNDHLYLGDGQDINIYHDGTDSYFYTGAGTAFFRDASNNKFASFISGGAIELFHSGSKKLETAGHGINITGGFIATGNSLINDNGKIQFGNSSDLQIFHDGNHSYISDTTGQGNLRVQTNNLRIENAAGNQNQAIFTEGGSVELYHSNAKVLETVAAGIKVQRLTANNSYVEMVNSSGIAGYLYGETTNNIQLLDSQGHPTVKGVKDGAVELYHDNAIKLSTTSTGIEINGSTDNARISFGDAYSNTQIGYFGLNRFGIDGHDGLEVRDSSASYATRFKIDQNGYVGIGDESSLNSMLHIEVNDLAKGIGDATGIVRVHNDSTATNSASNICMIFENTWHRIQYNAWETSGLRMGIRSTFSHGGTTGGGHLYFTTYNDTIRLTIDSSGNFSGSGSNDISDGRLKENIALITNATAKIKQLVGKTFNWKSNTQLDPRTRYGFIAQEVKPILPDLVYQDVGINRVSKDADKQGYGQGEIVDDYSDEYKDDTKSEWSMAVQTTGIIPVLVEAFKELEARVAALEAA